MRSTLNSKRLLLLWVFLLLTLYAMGQKSGGASPCNQFQRLMREARQAVVDNDFGMAIKKYNAAKVCHPAAGLEINEYILNAFSKIDEQRIHAERNARKAREAEKEALYLAQLAKKNEQEALSARRQAERNEQLALEQEAEARRYLSEIYLKEGQRAADQKSWDKALVNFFRSCENDTTNSKALQAYYQAADSVLPEFLTLFKASPIVGLQFSPDEKFLVSASTGNFQFLNLETYQQELVVRNNWGFNQFYFPQMQDSIIAANAYWNYGLIRFWHLGKDEEIAEYRKNIYAKDMFFDSEDMIMGYTTYNGDLVFSELENDSLLSWILPDTTNKRIEFDYLPGKNLIAVSYPQDKDNSIKIIDITELKEKRVKFMESFGSEVQRAVFHPDGRWIAASSVDNTVRIFNVETGQELIVFRENKGLLKELVFSADGTHFAYAVNDTAKASSRIVLYTVGNSASSFHKRAEVNIISGQVASMDISPGSKWLAAVIGTRTVKLWPLDYQLPAREQKTLEDLIEYGISFSVDQDLAYRHRNDSLQIERLYHAANNRKISWLPDGGSFLSDAYRKTYTISTKGMYLDSLSMAFLNSNWEGVRRLMDEGANPLANNDRGLNALLFAAHYQFKDVFQFFSRDLSLKQLEKEFLWAANVYNGSLQIIEFYLDNEIVDVNCRNENGETALHIASHNEDTAVVNLLLAKGANPDLQNGQGNTPFLIALWYDNYLVAQRLSNAIDNVNVQGDGGCTPLILAARNDYLDMTQFLIDKGSDINAKDDYGWSALHYAARNNNTEMIRLLVSNGADVEIRNDIGQTPLHLAAGQGEPDCLQLLIDSGANFNALDSLNNTPLLNAVYKGSVKMTALLLKAGANPNIGGLGGYTPLLQAKSSGMYDIYNLLLEWGAKDRKSQLEYPVFLSGHGTNVTANKTANIFFTVYYNPEDSLYRAVGKFDDKNLFGSFDVIGKELYCPGEEVCLQFNGLILNGYANDNFPKGTSTKFVMSLVLHPERATGTYHIGKILNIAADYEQYGILNLQVGVSKE